MYGKNLKLVLMVMLLLVSKSTFSQVTERERPKEWSQLVKVPGLWIVFCR